MSRRFILASMKEIPTLATLIKQAIDNRLLDVHTAMIGRVERYDAEKQLLTWLPCSNDTSRIWKARGQMHKYLLEQSGLHPPKSPMGKAITYALNNWTELTRFVDDERLPLDNNKSERALRIIAIGRKNYLFAGAIQQQKI